MNCSRCNAVIEKHTDSCSTGYGVDKDKNPVCYPCCAEEDKRCMREHGKITLYLTVKFQGQSSISNWPGSLVFDKVIVHTGRHNIAGVRYDCWFAFDGFWWWGVRYGDNTQLVHCKRTKRAA